MKNILSIIIALSSLSIAQDKDLSQGLGFSGGMPSGSGFSYRQMHENYGFQITAGLMAFNQDDFDDYYFYEGYTNQPIDGRYSPPYVHNQIISETSYEDTRFWGNLGLSFYKPLHRAKRSLFYALVAGSTYFKSETRQTRDYRYTVSSDSATASYLPISGPKEVTETDFKFFIGAGLGVEYHISDNIRIHLEMPITFVDDGNIYMYIPQGGIHYYFK